MRAVPRLPRDRPKTPTAPARAEPIVEAVTTQRLALLARAATTAPHAGGVLVLDDTGDRKAGTATAHVARQYLGSVGKVDTGIVAVTSLWAD